VQQTLSEAIASLSVIRFTYRGCPRRVHPLIVLINDDDELVLSGWQVEGTSSSGRTIPDWGNYTLSGITELVVEAETFSAPPPDYNPDRYRRIVCAVPKSPPYKRSW
jgi:hypothetical protein